MHFRFRLVEALPAKSDQLAGRRAFVMSSSSRIRSRNDSCESTFRSCSHVNVVLSVSRNCEGTVTLRAGVFHQEVLLDGLGKNIAHVSSHLQHPVSRPGFGQFVQIDPPCPVMCCEVRHFNFVGPYRSRMGPGEWKPTLDLSNFTTRDPVGCSATARSRSVWGRWPLIFSKRLCIRLKA